jgi:cellulose synthase/poly-beta-1,6-N-acetylglucosamine synthase-like glycosyltransferase
MRKNSKRDHKSLKIGLSGLTIKSSNPYVVVCVPAFNEEASIARVVLMAERYVDRVVVCDDGSHDLTSPIAETTCFYVSCR